MCSKAPKFLAFKERPKEGVRLLVKRNVEAMVKSALEDIATWSLNSEVRYTFLLQLYSIILCCEDGIVPFTGKITSTLYRFVADEDKKMSSVACEIAYALGFYSTPEVFVPIFINDFQQKEESTEENAPSTQITRCAILVLLEELKGTVSEDIAKHVGTLIDAIDREIPNLDPTLIPALLLLVHKLVEATGEGCKEFRPLFFRLVLSLGGVCDLKEAKDFVSGIMEKLSVNCGLKDAHELFSNELESALEEYKKTYKTWDKNSLERFAFDALVRNSNTAIADHWENITEIISACIDVKKDYELRFDTLKLIEHLIESEEAQSSIEPHATYILDKILLPSCMWKPGKPVAKIRKAAITCVIKMLERNQVDRKELCARFKEIMNSLKSCLDDDWADDLRFAACAFVKYLLSYLVAEIQSKVVAESRFCAGCDIRAAAEVFGCQARFYQNCNVQGIRGLL
eukprot:TRINITY_DN10518_c0_g2_i4.p1 TRINITY_DN10518_c0_g2~~TRINITY_DN10518_c0_g2_i4.p1  ORF type:complete len:457 (-),score=96.01 TRINITY_DN10518_c0_g2_i4:301-1671(-)